MEEYFCRPPISLAVSSARSAPRVSAAEYRYSPWPASSCTLASRIALRRRLGARLSQFPSGCMPMISEWACWAICRIRVFRYAAGIQSRGSIRESAAIVSSKYRCSSSSRTAVSVIRPPLTLPPLLTDRSFGFQGRPRMAEPARRGRPGYDRDRLLRVAVDVFNERGYDGTSMEDLAARLGITKSSIYHHVSG